MEQLEFRPGWNQPCWERGEEGVAHTGFAQVPRFTPCLKDNAAVDDLAQSNLHERLGALTRSVSPRTQLLQVPSSLSPALGLARP